MTPTAAPPPPPPLTPPLIAGGGGAHAGGGGGGGGGSCPYSPKTLDRMLTMNKAAPGRTPGNSETQRKVR